MRFFPDLDQGALSGFNRVLTGANLATVVDENGDTVSGVGLTVPAFSTFNNSATTASTSGDASWVSPSSHLTDPLALSAVDAWVNFVHTGLTNGQYTVETWSYTQAALATRVYQARVNGGTSQIQNTNENTSQVLRFEPITVSDGTLTVSFARHSSSSGGTAYVRAWRVIPFVATPEMTVTTDDIQPGTAENILCTNFGAAPDDTTMSLNVFDDGVGTNSMALSVTVTDNMDDTYDLDFTPPALPSSGSASYIRFTDTDAGITHTISIDTV